MSFIMERLLDREDCFLSLQTLRMNRVQREAFRILSAVIDEIFQVQSDDVSQIRTEEVVSRIGGASWEMMELMTWNGAGISHNGGPSIVKGRHAEL